MKSLKNVIRKEIYKILNENTTTQVIRKLKEDTEYQKFFMAALDKFGVKSPADFSSEEKKKEFFDYVDKNYKAKTESIRKHK